MVSLRLGFDNTGAVDVARQLRAKVGVEGDQPGEIDNGRVRLYVIGQGPSARRRRTAPNTTSRRPSAGTCRSF